MNIRYEVIPGKAYRLFSLTLGVLILFGVPVLADHLVEDMDLLQATAVWVSILYVLGVIGLIWETDGG